MFTDAQSVLMGLRVAVEENRDGKERSLRWWKQEKKIFFQLLITVPKPIAPNPKIESGENAKTGYPSALLWGFDVARAMGLACLACSAVFPN